MEQNHDVYRTLGEIQHSLGNIEAKLDTVSKLEPRVTILEQHKSWTTGAAAGIGAVVGFLLSLFKN